MAGRGSGGGAWWQHSPARWASAADGSPSLYLGAGIIISSNILKFITEIINTNTDINNNDTIISFSTNKIKDGTQKIIKSAYNTFSQYNNNLLRTKETKNKNLLSIAP